MKTIKFTFILVLAIVSFAPFAETKAQDVSVSVNFNTFQQELSPYGRWMNDARYGQVWIYNDADFKPYYTDGHWEYTNYGWSWISDYDWGWAPFHYGRWEYDPYYGWMWIPGYEWASAWVSWSSVDDYYGWAPLGYGVNINVSFGSIAHDRWNFIPRRNICDRDVYRYCEPYGRNNNFRNAVVINNYYNGRDGVGRFVRGPERREVERYTNNRIEERRVNYNDRSWNRGSNVRNRNDDNNGRRNNDAGNRNNNDNNGNGNNRRRNEANSNNNSNTGDQPNRGQGNNGNRPDRGQNNDANQNNNDNRPDWRRNSNGTQQNNGTANDNNPRRRDVNQNRDNNTTPPVIENRRPQRDVNSTPQTDENNPGRRQNDNRWNRSNDQQNNNQQQRQQNERQPQQQRQPVERQAPQQQQPAPVTEQRRMERRTENTNNGNAPRSDENAQRDRGNNGRRRNG